MKDEDPTNTDEYTKNCHTTSPNVCQNSKQVGSARGNVNGPVCCPVDIAVYRPVCNSLHQTNHHGAITDRAA